MHSRRIASTGSGAETDALAAGVDLPREFILPGESTPGAALDVARTVTRRGERHVVALAHAGHEVNPTILGYLNRLSSLLFIAARIEDRAAGSDPTAGQSVAESQRISRSSSSDETGILTVSRSP